MDKKNANSKKKGPNQSASSAPKAQKTADDWERKFPPRFIRPIRGLTGRGWVHRAQPVASIQANAKHQSGNNPSLGPANPSFAPAAAPLGGDMHAVAPGRLRAAGAPAPSGVGLSGCAAWYAKSLSAPFGEFKELPCVPSNPPVPSYRFRNVYRGTFSTGTLGVGFLTFPPYDPRNNSANPIVSSTAAYAGTTFAFSGTPGTSSANKTGLPFATADFAGTPAVQSKLVSAGIRVRNITQAVNVGGMIFPIALPSDGNLQGLTNAQIKAYPGTQLIPQVLTDQTDWTVLIQRPTDVNDLDFNESGTINSNYCLGIMAEASSPGTPNLFEYEIIDFWEFIGVSSTGARVPEVQLSHADEVGLARVMEAAQEMPVSGLQRDINRQMAEGVVEAIAHSDSTAKTVESLLGLTGLPLKTITGLVSSLVGFLAA